MYIKQLGTDLISSVRNQKQHTKFEKVCFSLQVALGIAQTVPWRLPGN